MRLTSLDQLKLEKSGIAVACGFFDGVHVGHQKVIEEMVAYSREHDLTPVLFTFSPHPRKLLYPDSAPELITSEEHRHLILQRDFGLEYVIEHNFNRQTVHSTAEDFVKENLLKSHLDLKAIFCGAQWRFGHKGKGGADTLRELGEEHGFDVFPVDEFCVKEDKVSSTRIRELIRRGSLSSVETLLGRRFSIYGKVQHGDKIASKILNCPTANLKTGSETFPPNGVYAGFARLPDGVTRPGVINIGHSPTFHGEGNMDFYKLEFHVFDFDGDLYDHNIEIEFVKYMRPEENYPSLELLQEAIDNDLAEGRKILEKVKPQI